MCCTSRSLQPQSSLRVRVELHQGASVVPPSHHGIIPTPRFAHGLYNFPRWATLRIICSDFGWFNNRESRHIQFGGGCTAFRAQNGLISILRCSSASSISFMIQEKRSKDTQPTPSSTRTMRKSFDMAVLPVVIPTCPLPHWLLDGRSDRAMVVTRLVFGTIYQDSV